MTILLVDDQKTVIEGLLSGVDFNALGFETVRTAYSAEGALNILAENPVDVLITDIEMPGRNGLELNSIVREQYPGVLRILLTSHANFSYAQEGLRLGCFDYLVQPVPYHVITESLKKAAQQIETNRRVEELGGYGELFKLNRTDFLNTVTYRLYSRDHRELIDAISLLGQAGYSLRMDTECQLIVVDVFDFSSYSPDALSHHDLRTAFVDSVNRSPIPDHLNFLITLTRPAVLILLFSDGNGKPPCSESDLNAFFSELEKVLSGRPFACYVGESFRLESIREMLNSAMACLRENIDKKPGVWYVQEPADGKEPAASSLPGHLSNWAMLLREDRRAMLKSAIFTYLDGMLAGDSNRYQNLCELHQQLTQIFFRYFYDNEIDINSIFNESYTYSDYMESYSSVDSFKKAVSFVLDAEGSRRENVKPLSYVEKAQAFIAGNTYQQLTVKNVADHINLNPEYFTRLFKKETGISIKDYILQCKVAAAQDLLANSALPISLIALELGYENFSHFTQMFRKETGSTPSEYRQQFTKKKSES